MTAIVPTVGRVVLYKMSSHNASEINRRREHARESMDYHRWKKNGTMVHVGNHITEGDVFPMIVVRVWGNTPDAAINGKVLLDGSDDYWATSVSVGDKPGSYHWMDYQKGQAAKAEKAESDLEEVRRLASAGTSLL